MKLAKHEIASMIDLSGVQAFSGEDEVRALVRLARQYKCGVITVLPSQTALAIALLKGTTAIRVSGNVGFPSGGNTTQSKVFEAKELIAMGCAELDMVLNISMLLSGDYRYVLEDIKAVVAVNNEIAVKVILECHYLSDDLIRKGCELCLEAGAAFVKTGSGWAPTGASAHNIALIKSVVGNEIGIKASGGIRSLEGMLELYRLGATRFGIGLSSAVPILEALYALPGNEIVIEPSTAIL
jgi:deoxyribose-phosphate aldolase